MPRVFNHDEKEGLITSVQKTETRSRGRLLLIVGTLAACLTLCGVSSAFAYYLGHNAGYNAARPRLPTHDITKDAVRYELKMLDDEFFAVLPENLRFMGNPRPELDQAWDELLGKGFNIRVPKDAAKKANFTSIELDDGSGDLWATTVFYHNLHCIKYLRQAHFPETYPATWEIMKPQEDGSISLHADHCLENLRQAIMCAGDTSLYHYYWNASSPNPGKPTVTLKTPHVCVNWDRLQSWMKSHSFSLKDGLVRHPTLGVVEGGD